MRATFAALLFLAVTTVAQAQSREWNGEPARPHSASQRTDRIIVKWRSDASGPAIEARAEKLGQTTGMRVARRGAIAPSLDVLQLDNAAEGAVLADLLARLNADPAVEYAAPDLRRHAHALPNDPLETSQWYLQSAEAAALRSEQAWDVTTGSTGTVVAVLDTGVRFEHPDLLRASQGGKLLPGYDFVSGESASSFFTANDGDGRDPDPSDPGDWVSAADLSRPGLTDCDVANSSWHGTRVSGLIGAITNNSTGVAGGSWSSWILPVRVLGRCGGFDSDIIAAMRWAAGLPVGGVPTNPYPAKIINLSLGGAGACTAAYQSAVAEITAAGALIVASAGNEGGPVNTPANCLGVLGVAGVRHAGTKVGFSSLGAEIGIAGPGGNCVNTGAGQPCLFSIVVPTNLGTTGPGLSSYTDQLNFNVGTSFSAPLVAGAAALMHAVNGRLGPGQLTARLQRGASPFPPNPSTGLPTCHVPINNADLQASECYCTTQTCGAGMVNANGAVSEALRPAAVIQVPAAIAPGQNLTLDGSSSAGACNRTIASYAWSVESSSGAPPALSATNGSSVTTQAPATGEFRLRLTVTDNEGAQDSAEVTVTPTTATSSALPLVSGDACPAAITIAQDTTTPTTTTPTQTPQSGGGGGGGGGVMGIELLALALLRRRKAPLASS
jgi:serine protease